MCLLLPNKTSSRSISLPEQFTDSSREAGPEEQAVIREEGHSDIAV